jgi:hypothetical protein
MEMFTKRICWPYWASPIPCIGGCKSDSGGAFGTGGRKCITRKAEFYGHIALRKELEAGKGDALAYDDKLVRDFIEKIEVFPEMMRFTMRTGMVTEVEM